MIKTCRENRNSREYGKYKCEFCRQTARYWTQNGTSDGKKLGRVIYHCQSHRTNARHRAEQESK